MEQASDVPTERDVRMKQLNFPRTRALGYVVLVYPYFLKNLVPILVGLAALVWLLGQVAYPFVRSGLRGLGL